MWSRACGPRALIAVRGTRAAVRASAIAAPSRERAPAQIAALAADGAKVERVGGLSRDTVRLVRAAPARTLKL